MSDFDKTATEVNTEMQELRNALRVGFEMRKAQREYFRTKSKDDLIAAKRLEAAFDQRLAALGWR